MKNDMKNVIVPVEPTLATFETPDFAARTHAPHMEGWAYNQMPKAGWSDLKLFKYDGTDLYQWFGKKAGSVFEDAEGEPFAIKPAAPSRPESGGRVMADGVVPFEIDDLAKQLHAKSQGEGARWAGRRTNRAYYRRLARAELARQSPTPDALKGDAK